MGLMSDFGLEDVAGQFARVPMFPIFDLMHYTLSIMYLKHEAGVVDLSRRSPITCWVCSMLCCFGGGMLAAAMLGEPILDPFESNINVFLASVIWYMIFYFPKDLYYRLCSLLPVKLFVVAGKEVTRVRKIAAGVAHAHHVYKRGYVVMVAVGIAKGAGSGLLANLEQLLRGVWKPNTNELLNMSFPTKATLLGAVLFTVEAAGWLPLSEEFLILIVTIFLVTTKVMLTAMHSHASPFDPIETPLCGFLFGAAPPDSDGHGHGPPSGPAAPAQQGKAEPAEPALRKRKSKKAE